ncbi:MAG: signal peptidase I [Firmicutes bacterium]|nr:signal peptidase I [Bacillota bacterium]
MEKPGNFFVEELCLHFEEKGRSLSGSVKDILSRSPLDFNDEDRRTYEELIRPARELIKYALRERLKAPGARRRVWADEFLSCSQTLIGGIVAEILVETDPSLEGLEELPGLYTLSDLDNLTEFTGTEDSAGRPEVPGQMAMEYGSEREEGALTAVNEPTAPGGQEGAVREEGHAQTAVSTGMGVESEVTGPEQQEPVPVGTASEVTWKSMPEAKKGRERKKPEASQRKNLWRGVTEGQEKSRRPGLRKAIKILGWAATLLVAVFVLLAAFLMVAPRFGLEVHPVLSGSMEPALRVGGIILCKEVPVSEVAVGDVIGFNAPGGMKVTHRVIDIIDEDGKRWFQTKGDANEDPDPELVSISGETVDKVVYHLPYLGFFASFMRSRAAFLVFICGPAAILVILFGRDIWVAVQDLRREGKKRVTDGGDGT